MINNYQDIDKYFGTPLDSVPTPRVPFKLKPWHVIFGTTAILLMGYGAKKFCEGNINDHFTLKDKRKK